MSGLVMLYVPYPSLSAAEKLAGGEAIDWSAVAVPPPRDDGRLPQELLLEMRDGRPVWRIAGWDGAHTTVAARRGAVLQPVDASYAGRVASRFVGAPPEHVERLIRDQWTVGGGFDSHRPLWDPMPSVSLDRLRVVGAGAVTAQLIDNAGTPLVLLSYRDGRRSALNAATLTPSRPTRQAIVEAARRLEGAAPLLSIDRLTAPDAYWYAVGTLPRLPVLRLRFADPAQTWLYIDPATGESLASVDRRQRAYRWAFDLLHKWDLGVLTLHRPAWDVLIWLFSIAGVVTSTSGIWLGWKRLTR